MTSEESAATLFSKISNPELFQSSSHLQDHSESIPAGKTDRCVSVSTKVNSPDSTITPEEIMGLDQGDGRIYATNMNYHILILQ